MPDPKIAPVTGKTVLKGRKVHNCCHEAYTACFHMTISELISCSPYQVFAFLISSAEMPNSCSFQDLQGSGVSSLGDAATQLLAFQPYAGLLQSKDALSLHYLKALCFPLKFCETRGYPGWFSDTSLLM